MLVEIASPHAGRTVPEYHGREVYLRHSLELGIAIDPLSQPASDPNVLPDQRLQAVDSKVPDHEPELERAKTAAQCDPVIHQVGDTIAFTHHQELGNVLERALQQVRMPGVERGAIHWCEQPLVRVHN